MATERIEETIVRNLLCNEEYYRKVIPHLDIDYFEQLVDRTIFEEIKDFSGKYDKLPTKEVLRISLGQRNDVTDETYKSSLDQIASYTEEWVDFDWAPLMRRRSGVRNAPSTTHSWSRSRSQMAAIRKYQRMRSRVSCKSSLSIV